MTVMKVAAGVILLTFAQPAICHQVVVVSKAPTFGCPTAEPLRKIDVAQILSNAPLPGGCFHIPAGTLAYSAPEWLSGADFQIGGPNVAVLAGQSGRRFYSWASTWRFVADVETRQFVP
jgi:hypothetical protein